MNEREKLSAVSAIIEQMEETIALRAVVKGDLERWTKRLRAAVDMDAS